MSRLTVQHWIACLEVQVEPPAAVYNFYNLLRVGPLHTVSPDTEFPASFTQLDMFARFLNGVGVWEFEVDVLWVDSPKGLEEVAIYGPQTIHFRQGQPVRDYRFRLNNVPIPGIGRYRVRLWAIRRGRRRPLAVEY